MSSRIYAFDGLRGLAALVVVLHHSLLLVPALAAPHFTVAPVASTFSITWWMVHSPVHLLWSGSGPVYIFFVLSGVVLTLGVLNSTQFSWLAYFPARLVRLYVPVWCAVFMALALIALAPRIDAIGMSAWVEARPVAVSAIQLIRDLVLIGGAGFSASPLWSLQWEVLFSLLLPLFIWVAQRLKGNVISSLLAGLTLTTIGGLLGLGALIFLPMFYVGAVLAVESKLIGVWGDRVQSSRRPSLYWSLLLVCGLGLLHTYWLVLLSQPPSYVLGATAGPTLAGALVIVFLAWRCPAAQNLLACRPIQWLGTISFSLYLIHEPIVLGFNFILGSELLWIAIPAAIVLSLVLAPMFYFFIEKPSLRLARLLKRYFSPTPVHDSKRLTMDGALR